MHAGEKGRGDVIYENRTCVEKRRYNMKKQDRERGVESRFANARKLQRNGTMYKQRFESSREAINGTMGAIATTYSTTRRAWKGF